jgi:hypothetical protein
VNSKVPLVPFWVIAILGLATIGGWIVFAVLAHSTTARVLGFLAAALAFFGIVSIYFDRKKRRGSGSH